MSFFFIIYLFNSAAIKTYKINLAHIKLSYFIPSSDLFFVPDTKYTMAELFPWLYNNVLLCHNPWFGIYSTHTQNKKALIHKTILWMFLNRSHKHKKGNYCSQLISCRWNTGHDRLDKTFPCIALWIPYNDIRWTKVEGYVNTKASAPCAKNYVEAKSA